MPENPFESKIGYLLKMLGWTQVLMISCAFFIPGIIISMQYFADDCVTSNNLNVRLDEWLFVGAIMQFAVVVSFLPTVCCVWKHWFPRVISLAMVVVLNAWAAIGIYLMVVSNLTKCNHESLWWMSLFEIIYILVFVFIYYGVQLYSIFQESCGNGSSRRSCFNGIGRLFRCCDCCGFGCCDDNGTIMILETDQTEDEEARDLLKWFREQNMDSFLVNNHASVNNTSDPTDLV